MSTPEAGQVWAGRFRITGPAVGEGASTSALPAVDEQTGREVVLRVLHPHLRDDAAARARLEALAGVAGRLLHPRVATVRGLWSGGGHPFLVVDRVQGIPLDAVEGPLLPEAAAALGVQVCEALAAAHAIGLVHGDLRPGHVLLGPAGAKVVDFGVAGVAGVEPPVRAGQTAPEVHAGTPGGRAADLYGLGVVLYRALTGELPYRTDNPFAALASQHDGPVAPPGPAGLAALVRALLDPDPLRRPADAGAVLSSLRALRQRPHRRVRPARRWLAPIRPRRAWVVHGVDPATGGRAVMAAQIGGLEAGRLVRRLREEGWEVCASREALSARDLAWVALLALLGGALLSVFGLALGGVLGLKWRSRKVQPRIREALPPVRAPLPPPSPDAWELPLAAGACLLLTALCLWLEPWTALLPALGLLVAAAVALRRPAHADRLALRARLGALFTDLRRGLAQGVGDLDLELSLQGELEALEQGWRAGSLADDEVLARAEALERRSRAARDAAEASVTRSREVRRREAQDARRGEQLRT